jgi:CHAD domain-containing protein
MTALPADLLARPAAQSVRLIAQGFLDAAVRAAERLSHGEDADALHDFRVALRRLRTTLRAYRPELKDSIPRKVQQRLRAVAAATDRARDAEVALAWLQPLKPELKPRERVGWRWLVERIERRRAKGLRRAGSHGWRAFGAVGRRLRNGLAVYRQPLSPHHSSAVVPFAVVVRTTLLEHAKRLDELLSAVHTAADPEAHRARIAAKRLRYLLEALVDLVPVAPGLVERLKALQDGLGELHDVLELEREVRKGVASVAAKRASRALEVALVDQPSPAMLRAVRRRDPKAGLVALARRLRVRRTALFADLQANWLGRDGAWGREIEAVVAPFTSGAPSQPVPVPVPVPRRRAPRPVHHA